MRFNFFLICFLPLICFSQKKVIDHTSYKDWKRTEKQQVSTNGKLVVYETNPLIGDGFLFFYNVETQKLDSFSRAKDAKIAKDESFFAFKITPGFDTLRKCELQKIEMKKWPKDSLFIYQFTSDSLIKIPKLKNFQVATEGSVLAYTTEGNQLPEKKKARKCFIKKKKSDEVKSDGNILTLFSLSGQSQLKNITDFKLSEDGSQIAVIQHEKVKIDSFKLSIYASKSFNEAPLFIGKNVIAQKLPEWNKSMNKIAFLSSQDTNKTKQFTLTFFDFKTNKSRVFGDSNDIHIDKKLGVSEHRSPLFTDNDKYLFFGISDRISPEEKDTLLESEKVKVDVWHYLDKQIQAQQLVELNDARKKSAIYVLNLSNDSIIALTNDTISSYLSKKIIGDYILGTNSQPYQIQAQWKSPGLEDVYRISLLDGSRNKIAQAIAYGGQLSPLGNYYTFFDPKNSQQYILDIYSNTQSCMSCSAENTIFHEDINGQPMDAGPQGEYGFVRDETDFIFKSEFDIWSYNLASKTLKSLTNGEGMKRNIELDLVKWSNDSVFIDLADCYIKGFNKTTKGFHLFSFYNENGEFGLFEQKNENAKLMSLERSKNKETLVLRNMTVSQYPEIILINKFFQNERTISHTNSQQNDYNWATVELIKWKAFDGEPLEGLLYKPENFDPSKKYPLLVYFYELNSENLHNHLAPRPSASTINPTEYASAGYFVLIPDIRYSSGFPAKSAYNCIVSGTDFVVKNYPINENKLGLQGQSWGGYQTAQLITMTTKYVAAMAGAPVSNMFSAYGGIRWGTGLNRQFQYESTQSRIGKTIWDAPERYIENSPLFHLPNVKTPLLIMHNDSDGAVPWYQGIELYNGMRRLGKPCWLLNYNDDDHNLKKAPNRIDLSIRMRQFFDHYLLDKPAPEWLKNGLPALEKGKKFGYETEE